MQDTTIHYRGRYIALVEREDWEFATRSNARAVAVLVAVTPDRRLVLVEQYRIPVRRRVVELPAGLVGDGDDPGEALVEAARRELVEETGYAPGRMSFLLECPSTAGLSDEMVHFFLAEDLERTGPGGGDDSEDIEVHLVEIDQAEAWLARRQAGGAYLDPKIFTALCWLRDGRWQAVSG